MSKYEMVEIIDSGKIIAKEFNRCKEDLKLFSEQTEKDINLPTVNYYESFLFVDYDHKVTGGELNELTSKLQEHLKNFNNINNKIIREFSAIYNTFNALDNEYIKNIMQSLKKSNEAINKANLGLTEAEKRIEDIRATNGKLEVAQNNIKIIQDELEYAQKDLDKHMEIQKKIVDGLTLFKGKIDSYKHLKDIDNMWENLEKLVNKIPIISENINNIKIDVQKNISELNDIKRFKDKLENYKHLENIDNIWVNLQNLDSKVPIISGDINNIKIDVQKNISELNDIKRFKDKLENYKHLENIDNIWVNLQNLDSKVPIISGDINNIKIDVQKNISELNDIKRFKDKLENYKHLEDIDKIWNDLDYLRVIKNKLEVVENLDKLTNDVEGLKKLNSNIELRLRNTFNFIEQQKKKIEDLETSLQATQNENISLSKKLNMSYLLGGGALILGIFNIFYLFLRG